MSLLGMPPEIRRMIFELVIRSPGIPPDSPGVSQVDRGKDAGKPLGNRFQAVWDLPPFNPALPLLLVNKQLHHEAKHVKQASPTAYHVDVMYVKEYGLWPTWSIPVLPQTQYIDSVDIEFRIFDPTEDLNPRFRRTESSTISHTFHNFLLELLKNGPGSLKPRPPANPEHLEASFARHVVKKISVDILTPTDGAAHRSIMLGDNQVTSRDADDRRRQRALDIGGDEDSRIPPEIRMAQYIVKQLDFLMTLGYHTLNYGVVILEGVRDSIEVLVNGEIYKRYDIEEIVKDHDVTYWGKTDSMIVKRKVRYRIWRDWLEGRRVRMRDCLELDDDRPLERIM